jgi:hypothetical protein
MREGKGRENVFSTCCCCLSNVVNVEKGGKEQGEAEILWRIESIVLRAAGRFSNFNLCSKASVVLWLCFARSDAISGRAKDFSLRLCSGGQVHCWWRRLGFLCPLWAGLDRVWSRLEMPTHSVSLTTADCSANKTRTPWCCQRSSASACRVESRKEERLDGLARPARISHRPKRCDSSVDATWLCMCKDRRGCSRVVWCRR